MTTINDAQFQDLRNRCEEAFDDWVEAVCGDRNDLALHVTGLTRLLERWQQVLDKYVEVDFV